MWRHERMTVVLYHTYIHVLDRMASRYVCRREEAEKVFVSLASFAGSSADRSPHIRQWVPLTRLGREGGGPLRIGRSGAVLTAAGRIPYFFFVCHPIGFLNQEQSHVDFQGPFQGFSQQFWWSKSLRVFVVSASCWL